MQNYTKKKSSVGIMSHGAELCVFHYVQFSPLWSLDFEVAP